MRIIPTKNFCPYHKRPPDAVVSIFDMVMELLLPAANTGILAPTANASLGRGIVGPGSSCGSSIGSLSAVSRVPATHGAASCSGSVVPTTTVAVCKLSRGLRAALVRVTYLSLVQTQNLPGESTYPSSGNWCT
jgi:hypothetical protein